MCFPGVVRINLWAFFFFSKFFDFWCWECFAIIKRTVRDDLAMTLLISRLRLGEGNGSPLQCSCLENPRDSRAWWAAVCRVTQSQTRLKRLSSSSRLRLAQNVGEWVNKSGYTYIILFMGKKSYQVTHTKFRKQMSCDKWNVKMQHSSLKILNH